MVTLLEDNTTIKAKLFFSLFRTST